MPLVIGDPDLAVEACERALRRGVFAQAIRPPTVPDGTARLRLAAMATHTTGGASLGRRRARRGGREAGVDPSRLRRGKRDLFVDEDRLEVLDGPSARKAA